MNRLHAAFFGWLTACLFCLLPLGRDANAANLTEPQNGWWWNAAESGTGYAIERQGNVIYMATFLYDDDGAPMWYTSALTRQSNGSYVGSLDQYAGGQSLLGAYKAPVAASSVGVATLVFMSGNRGSISVRSASGSLMRSTAIERFPLSRPAFTGSYASGHSGWWWNSQESGRGFFIEVQGTIAFIGSFMFDVDGKPTWYVAEAQLQGATRLTGNLSQFRGGQSLTGVYRAPSVQPSPGSFSVQFSSNTTGELILPNNQRVSISRFMFSGPANSGCRASTEIGPVSAPSLTAPNFRYTDLTNLPPNVYYPAFMAALDVNGDGHQDMVVAETAYPFMTPYGARVAIYRGDGLGGFTDATASLLVGTAVPDHVRDMEVADFNGDGRPDVLFSNHGYDAFPFPGAYNTLLLNVGGKLVAASEALGEAAPSFTHSSASADIDCDGDIDYFEGNASGRSQTPRPRLLLNDGAATFQDASQRLPGSMLDYSKRYLSAEFCDFDNNGTKDLFLGGFNNASLLLLNNGRGELTPAPAGALPADAFPILPGGDSMHAIEARCVDIDRDGWNDLIQIQLDKPFATAAGPVQRRQVVWMNTRNGSFVDATAQWMPPMVNTGFLTSMRVVDVNNDGWPDLTLTNGETVQDGGLLMNTGTSFVQRMLVPGFPQSSELLYEIDFDGDGKQEYVSLGNTIRLFRRN